MMRIADNWKQTFVCCDCRKSARCRFYVPTCPSCHEEMTGIGTKWRVPKKNDNKEWHLLEALIQLAQTRLEKLQKKYPDIRGAKHVRLSCHTLFELQVRDQPRWKWLLTKLDPSQMFLDKKK